jgi:hypothetical protein
MMVSMIQVLVERISFVVGDHENRVHFDQQVTPEHIGTL